MSNQKWLLVTLAAIIGSRLLANNNISDTQVISQDQDYDILQAVKAAFGPLSVEQMNSSIEIIAAFNYFGDGDTNKLAYILATAWHESWLRPIKEIRAQEGTALWNTQNAYWYTGYYGRGFVQLTHQSNYQKMTNFLGIDLVNNPDLALDTFNAASILNYGMLNGSFTGKSLYDYINPSNPDFYNARRIVNGTDRAAHIEGLTLDILNNLNTNA